MKTLIVFLVGLLTGGVVGALGASFNSATARDKDYLAEYQRYLRGTRDPRD